MSPSTSGNKKKLCKASADVIMNLPPNLIEQILESLPLTDAVRTSVLSRKWRYKWLSLSQITLDYKFSKALQKQHHATGLAFSREYSDAVNNILLRHRGPIHKFVLFVPWHYPVTVNSDCWIEFVCRNGVKDLNLYNCPLPRWKPPSCLFSCLSLTHLTLKCGPFSFSPTFEGFPCLISLKLTTSENDNEKLESLINNCPQLESLNLDLYVIINCLTIRASKLHDLVLCAMLRRLFLEEATRLKTLELHNNGGGLERVCMAELLSSVPNIEKLRLVKFFRCGLEPPKLLAKGFEHLHTLILDTPICQDTLSLVLCLLKCFPHLLRLHITALDCNCDYDCKLLQFDGSCSLESLKKVELLCFSGESGELLLAKFLLANSPALELMIIKLDTSVTEPEEKFDLAKEVTRFQRASLAEVILK